MELLEIFLLALGSMFWPLLLIVIVIALNTPTPAKILVAFYLGGFFTSIAVASTVVFALQGSPLMKGSGFHAAPWVYVVVSAAAIVGGLLLRRVAGRRAVAPPKPKKQSKGSERMEKLIAKGGPLGFVGGILASFLPGTLAIIAMTQIAQLDYSTGSTMIVIVCFYIVLFTFIEVPIVGFVFAPEWTAGVATRFNAWVQANYLWLASWVLLVVGFGELIRGLVTLIRQ